jgi:hypothetical protein
VCADTLRQVQMSIWTLHFQHDYERAYCSYLYEHAIARIRYAISIGLGFLLLKTGYEKLNVSSSDTTLIHEWTLVLQLHAFVAAPLLAAVLLCTLVRPLDRFCELYGAVPFLVWPTC